ncbi:MAG: hypothetical protein DF168_02223 [Candidatus Moanabacter tarae]|uniref:Chaperone protein Skp n=1 Tax=Candidatus Moanibacter tarae TaxID=2200854 RepID=A0A2Z4AIC2_9BACT|nr:MAG: hypothetical protein DF168_02223 [Candidatus Moanabacter tarae]|tara:strand:+ start:40067 stop:40645 length:579 start_codon:yes stop_codon:yes gene_type:complete
MKRSIVYLAAVTVLMPFLQGQEVNIATVDMTRLYTEYYKTKEANDKIQDSIEQARIDAEELVQDGQDLVEEYNEILERAKNPALTEEAQIKAQQDAEDQLRVIQEKQQELDQFRVATQRSLQQRQQTYRDLFMDEIKSMAMDVAREANSNLLLDTSGETAVGIPSILYSSADWDITEEVLSRINEEAPEDEG